MRIKHYYELTKPGIIYGNLIAVFAGFFLASHRSLHFTVLLGVIVGSSFIIGSGCIFNNCIDKDIDAKMARTSKRSLVVGEIKEQHAMIYGVILGISGLAILIIFVNLLTALLGVIGFIFYVIVYGFAKRKTIYSTMIGSISGAIPPVAGYTAVTNRIDTAAIILFLILTFWQMPHFYAIAIYRLEDYTKAGLMLWPIKRGVKSTQWQMLLFLVGFIITSASLTMFGYKDKLYLFFILALGVVWLYFCIRDFYSDNSYRWAKRMFFCSLISLLVVCIAISI